jgi:hypothetical protein
MQSPQINIRSDINCCILQIVQLQSDKNITLTHQDFKTTSFYCISKYWGKSKMEKNERHNKRLLHVFDNGSHIGLKYGTNEMTQFMSSVRSFFF